MKRVLLPNLQLLLLVGRLTYGGVAHSTSFLLLLHGLRALMEVWVQVRPLRTIFSRPQRARGRVQLPHRLLIVLGEHLVLSEDWKGKGER